VTTSDLVALVSVAGVLLGIIVNGYVALRVAALNVKVKDASASIEKVHVAVNSERTELLRRYNDLLAQLNVLKGAADQREKTDATAATFEAGRKEGAEGKGV